MNGWIDGWVLQLCKLLSPPSAPDKRQFETVCRVQRYTILNERVTVALRQLYNLACKVGLDATRDTAVTLSALEFGPTAQDSIACKSFSSTT